MTSRLMQPGNYDRPILAFHSLRGQSLSSGFNDWRIRVGLVLFIGVCAGVAVIVSTYYIDNIKLLIGLIGGLAFVLLTMRWPEFGILCFVALMSGLVRLSSLPLLHLGPVSLNISDIMLSILLCLVFLRATTRPGFVLFGSPLMLPLILFIGAFLLSAANAVLVYGVGPNTVLRTVRGLSLWVVFIPTLQLVRDERALLRLLVGLMLLTGVLLIGVVFPNRFDPLLALDETGMATGSQIYSGVTRIYYSGDMVLYAMIPVTIASMATIKKGNQLWRIGLLGFLIFWAFRTGFRQYWLTLLVICVLILWFLSGQERERLLKRMMPAIIASILIIAMLMVIQPNQVKRITYVLTDRVGSLLQDPLRREGSLQWRIIETRYALVQIERHPILGLGLANRYRPPMESEGAAYSGWASKYIENGYLYILLMMGLVGLLPFLWLCAAYLLRVLKYQHEIQDEGLRAVYIGFGVAFLGMVACSIATPTFVIGTRLVFFPLSMAISEIILRCEREKNAHKVTARHESILPWQGSSLSQVGH